MITEFVVAGITTYAYQKIHYNIKHKDEKQIIKKWNKIMFAAGIKNKEDISDTFKIININKTKYGFNCKVNIPDGFDADKLEGLKTIIQDNFKCLCEFDKQRFTNYTTVKIITNPLNNLTFKPEKTKPYEILLGYDYTGKPVILNMNRFSHLLIAGVVGTGKSRLGFTILTNLIHNHSEKEIEIYLTQLKKKDYKHFKFCKQVKQFSERLDETRDMFARLDKIIDKRTETIDKADAENIEEYNQKSKIKMKYIYLFAEEFSFYMEDKSDDEDTEKLKASALQHLKNIIVAGRSVGINVICTVQRTTVDNIPSTIKSQMSRITFRQMSVLNSTNIIESSDAVGLEEKECILFTNQYVRIKTPYIDKEIIQDNIKDSLLNIPVQSKVQNEMHYERHKPTPEEFAKMKDCTVRVKQTITNTKVNIKVKKRKNGVINLDEVKKDAHKEG
ncbi:MAG: FtsK/SpoIIIE domain-containing protein [Clostridium sp.]|uniref:FtsK/SpoIIIE domain-containing protein n=1 Tax=Clostridium sp. TaxID=1506 RepID=UPI0039EB3FAA